MNCKEHELEMLKLGRMRVAKQLAALKAEDDSTLVYCIETLRAELVEYTRLIEEAK